MLNMVYRYAMSVGAQHYHTSAKMNKGIEELFLDLTQRMISKSEEKRSSAAGSSVAFNNSRGRGNNITIVDDTDDLNSRNKKCCG